eukprot:g3963.t1
MACCRNCCCCYCGGPSKMTTADLPPPAEGEKRDVTLCVLTADDEADMRRVLQAGYQGSEGAQGEGLQHWILGNNSQDGLPTEEAKSAFFAYNTRFMYLQMRNYGGVILGAKIDGKIVGILTAFPPGKAIPHGGLDEMCMFCHLCCCKLGCDSGPMDEKKYGKGFKSRNELATKAFGSKSIHAVRKPLGKFWVLEALAVEPSARGRGVAAALVRTLGRLADRDNSATVVEFANEELLKFYAKFGFTEGDGLHELDFEGSKLNFYARVRRARGDVVVVAPGEAAMQR